MTNERGSILPMTGGLIFVALAVTALVMEIALLGGAYRDVATVADLAAESAAAVLSPAGAYDDAVVLDMAHAEAEARRIGSAWGSGDEVVAIDIDPSTVCVTVSDIYIPRTLAFAGITELTVRATGCASPAAG